MAGLDKYRNSTNQAIHGSDQQNTGKRVKESETSKRQPAHGLVKRHQGTSGSNKSKTDVAILG